MPQSRKHRREALGDDLDIEQIITSKRSRSTSHQRPSFRDEELQIPRHFSEKSRAKMPKRTASTPATTLFSEKGLLVQPWSTKNFHLAFKSVRMGIEQTLKEAPKSEEATMNARMVNHVWEKVRVLEVEKSNKVGKAGRASDGITLQKLIVILEYLDRVECKRGDGGLEGVKADLMGIEERALEQQLQKI